MPYRWLADAVVIVHFATVIFVIGGGVLVIRWRPVAWLHLPIIAWVTFAECFHRTCPLTYLENWFNQRAGSAAYQGDFVSHWIVPVLYPQGLTDQMQLVLGVAIFLINVTLYSIAFLRMSRRNKPAQASIATSANE